MPTAVTALAANKLPFYHRPPRTDFGPVIRKKSDEAKSHPLLDGIKTTLSSMSTVERTALLNFRLGWLQSRATAAANALTGAGLAADLPTRLVRATSQHGPLTNGEQKVGKLEQQLTLRHA